MVKNDGFTDITRKDNEDFDMHWAGDSKAVKSCMDYSFADRYDLESENSILKKDREVMSHQHLHVHPALTINR